MLNKFTKILSTLFSTYEKICLFHKSPFFFSKTSHPGFKYFDSFVSSFKYGTLTLFIAVIYRPPSSLSSFINDFSALLRFLYTLSSPFYIVGDFNIQFNNKTNLYIKKFLELFNLSQHCNFPSHSSSITINLFTTSSLIKPMSIPAHPVSFSDHYLIQSCFPTKPIRLFSTVKVSTCSWYQLGKKLFIQLLHAFFTDVDDFFCSSF